MKNTVYIFILLILQVSLFAREARTDDGSMNYNLGLQKKEMGDNTAAYNLFKKACLESDSFAEPCIEWGELAKQNNNSKDVMRAFSSAVMLNPQNVYARYTLAIILLEKQDYVWAIEHLSFAVKNSKNNKNKSILHYYLGYAYYKNQNFSNSKKELSKAIVGLENELKQRCNFYLGKIALAKNQREQFVSFMKMTQKGPVNEWSEAAKRHLQANSAFPFDPGVIGQLSASTGFNSHPSSAFIDESPNFETWVFQSIFRGDIIGQIGTKKHHLKSALTIYREQNWLDLNKQNSSSNISSKDLNLTLFLGQLGYLHYMWKNKLEHKFKIGLEGETQFLDHAPKKNSNGEYSAADDPFGLSSWAISLPLWWSFSAQKNSIYGVRLKVELRPNYIDENRSSSRYRLRIVNTRYWLNRRLQLKALVGIRYDLTYFDKSVVKYDRILPEADINLRWRLKIPRTTWLVGAKLKFNWYLNSKYNQENSFKLPWQDTNLDSNEAEEARYYDETRNDFEWEISTALNVDLWKNGIFAFVYRHHMRLSNIDNVSIPNHFVLIGTDTTDFGYTQDVLMLELKHRFI